MAKVSVIVPVYNVEPYLEEALRSLVRQTLRDIEIVVVNDGSTDNSLGIIRRFMKKDDRIILIDKENGGYGKAMNVGLDRASGEYIGILEPDDYVSLDMYEDLYETAHAEDLDMVKADFYRFMTDDKSGNVTMYYNHLDKSGEHYNQVLDPSADPSLTTFIMNTWSGIYRKSFLDAHNIRHHETPGAAFQDNGFFWQTFVYAKRAMFIDRPYYRNRRDNPNSSVNSKEKVYCMNREYDYIRELLMYAEDKTIWDRFKGYYNMKRYHNYIFTAGRIAPEFLKEYLDRISREFRTADSKGELDLTLFSVRTRTKLQTLMRSPEEYYQKYGKEDLAKKDMDPNVRRRKEIEESTTYKVGKIVMAVPIAVKDKVDEFRKQAKKH